MSMLRLFLVLTLICGGVYSALVTVIAQGLFPELAQGSLVQQGPRPVGSMLLAQKFTQEHLFHSRPSAADYASLPSGASQYSPTHQQGLTDLARRRNAAPQAAVDFWTTSGSGLDPHLTPRSALAQVARVAQHTGLSHQALIDLVNQHTQGPHWRILGRPRVNVLELNLAVLTKGTHAQSGSNSHGP